MLSKTFYEPSFSTIFLLQISIFIYFSCTSEFFIVTLHRFFYIDNECRDTTS